MPFKTYFYSQTNISPYLAHIPKYINNISNDTFAHMLVLYFRLQNQSSKIHPRLTLIECYPVRRVVERSNQRRKPERQRGVRAWKVDTDRCWRSRSVATMPWASPRGCCRCRWPPARTVTRQSGCFGCCCCYRCCYRFLRCQLVMQPTNQKTSYCQPPNSFLPVASGRFSPYRHSSIVALSRVLKISKNSLNQRIWTRRFLQDDSRPLGELFSNLDRRGRFRNRERERERLFVVDDETMIKRKV